MDSKEYISRFINNEIDKLKKENEELKDIIKKLKHENIILNNKIKAMKGQKQKGLIKRKWKWFWKV